MLIKFCYVIASSHSPPTYFFFFTGKPEAQASAESNAGDYQYDSYDSYDEYIDEEEEEKEIGYDINFVNSGSTHTVDKGTTIRLPCYIDDFPSKSIATASTIDCVFTLKSA